MSKLAYCLVILFWIVFLVALAATNTGMALLVGLGVLIGAMIAIFRAHLSH